MLQDSLPANRCARRLPSFATGCPTFSGSAQIIRPLPKIAARAFIISVPFYIIGEISRVFIKKKTGEDFRAIELGDTILMFAAGALLGTKAIIVSALIGIVVAAVAGLINKYVTGNSKFAFGPFLSIGIAVAALWGNRLADWYIKLLSPAQQ